MFELVSVMFEIEKVGKCYTINFEKGSIILESQDESTIINISNFKIVLNENFELQNKGRKIIFQNEDYGTVVPMFLAELVEYLDVDELFVEWWDNVGEIKDLTKKQESTKLTNIDDDELNQLYYDLEYANKMNLIDIYLQEGEFDKIKKVMEL